LQRITILKHVVCSFSFNDGGKHSAMTSKKSRKKLTTLQLLLAVIGGGLSAIGILLLALVFLRPPTLPQLNQERLDAATENWEAADVQNYDMTVVSEGRVASEFTVEVRNGKVRNAWRRDLADPNSVAIPIRSDHALETWSVGSMLRIIQIDLEQIARAKQGDPGGCKLNTWGLFEHSGVPTRYRRVEWGSDIDIGWNVTRFEVLASTASDE
jgi:hypothetical protein